MNKKGFTLTELLGVIFVLALIISVASMSAISIIEKNRDKANKEDEDALKEAAIMYVEDKEMDDITVNSDILIDEGIFEDKKGKCSGIDVHVKYNKTNHEYDVTLSKKCKN